MKTISVLAVLTALLSIAALLMAGRGRPPTPSDRFTGLGDLPGGSFDSVADGVSADGMAVVGHSNSAAGMEAFRWTPCNGMVGLGFTQAYAVSADGSVVVGYRLFANQFEPVRWTHDGGTVGLGKLTDSSYAAATGVSADGSVIVGSSASDSGEGNDCGFLWRRSSGMVRLERLPNGIRCDEARAGSADGAVVVGARCNESGRPEAFRWTTEKGIENLGVLPGFDRSFAHGLSANGAVVVGVSHSGCDTDFKAFRWTEDTGIVALGALGGRRHSRALGVSADGSVIVGQWSGESGLEAFIWDATHGMRSLRQVLENEFQLGPTLRGWKLISARAVSPDGRFVVGDGWNPSGNREAWIARLGNEHRPIAQADWMERKQAKSETMLRSRAEAAEL